MPDVFKLFLIVVVVTLVFAYITLGPMPSNKKRTSLPDDGARAKYCEKFPARLNYEDSISRLQEQDILDHNDRPVMPDAMPQQDDDDPLGLSFFRTLYDDSADQSNLTLARTFISRSSVEGVQFNNTDLSESYLRWNDFIGVSFICADLSGADMRGSIYEQVNFSYSNLSNVDLRHSSFEGCNFESANMSGAKLTHAQSESLVLSSQQKQLIDWQSSDGPTPSGG